MRDESLFGNIDKMLELVRVSNTIENDGGVTRRHVVALESIIPGIITSRHSTDSFTHGVSNYNNDTAYACVNRWALENGLPEEDVALESWSTFAKVAAGMGIAGAVIALIKWIINLVRGGGSSGSGTPSTSEIKATVKACDKAVVKTTEVIKAVIIAPPKPTAPLPKPVVTPQPRIITTTQPVDAVSIVTPVLNVKSFETQQAATGEKLRSMGVPENDVMAMIQDPRSMSVLFKDVENNMIDLIGRHKLQAIYTPIMMEGKVFYNNFNALSSFIGSKLFNHMVEAIDVTVESCKFYLSKPDGYEWAEEELPKISNAYRPDRHSGYDTSKWYGAIYDVLSHYLGGDNAVRDRMSELEQQHWDTYNSVGSTVYLAGEYYKVITEQLTVNKEKYSKVSFNADYFSHNVKNFLDQFGDLGDGVADFTSRLKTLEPKIAYLGTVSKRITSYLVGKGGSGGPNLTSDERNVLKHIEGLNAQVNGYIAYVKIITMAGIKVGVYVNHLRSNLADYEAELKKTDTWLLHHFDSDY